MVIEHLDAGAHLATAVAVANGIHVTAPHFVLVTPGIELVDAERTQQDGLARTYKIGDPRTGELPNGAPRCHRGVCHLGWAVRSRHVDCDTHGAIFLLNHNLNLSHVVRGDGYKSEHPQTHKWQRKHVG